MGGRWRAFTVPKLELAKSGVVLYGVAPPLDGSEEGKGGVQKK